MRRFRLPVTAMSLAICVAGPPRPAESNPEPPRSTPACIAIVLPSVQGIEGSATDAASAVRDLFVSYLTGPSIRAIALESRLSSQAVLEARQKNCSHVVIPSLVRKRSGGGKLGGVMGQAMETAAWRVAPYGTGVGAAVAAGAAAGGAHAVTRLAGETRRKDQIELAYRVGRPDDVEKARLVTSKGKAKVDGEDLLTPLVERAAQEIASLAQ